MDWATPIGAGTWYASIGRSAPVPWTTTQDERKNQKADKDGEANDPSTCLTK